MLREPSRGRRHFHTLTDDRMEVVTNLELQKRFQEPSFRPKLAPTLGANGVMIRFPAIRRRARVQEGKMKARVPQ